MSMELSLHATCHHIRERDRRGPANARLRGGAAEAWREHAASETDGLARDRHAGLSVSPPEHALLGTKRSAAAGGDGGPRHALPRQSQVTRGHQLTLQVRASPLFLM